MFEENISYQIEKEILHITRNTYVSVCVWHEWVLTARNLMNSA